MMLEAPRVPEWLVKGILRLFFFFEPDVAVWNGEV